MQFWNKYFFRFANTFKHNSVSVDNIQNVVKTVRAGTSLDLNCGGNYILADDGPLDQVKAVEQMLQIESSEQINDTLTREQLRTAGEMFLYLVSCPDKTKPWIVFYKDLFQTQSPDQIILTLNRLMKGSRTQTNEHFEELAEMLLKRILSFLHRGKAENTTSNIEAIPSQSSLAGGCIKHNHQAAPHFFSVCTSLCVLYLILKFLYLQILHSSTIQFTS